LKLPAETVGVPLILIRLLAQAAETPLGKPDAVPIPVAPVVVDIVIGDVIRSPEVRVVADGVDTVHTFVIVHGTPVQFSKAAFFQRTLISSKLYKAFLFISIGTLSFDWLDVGIVTFELDWAKLKSGNKDNSKILRIILWFLKCIIITKLTRIMP
jgi:hypothetical protein